MLFLGSKFWGQCGFGVKWLLCPSLPKFTDPVHWSPLKDGLYVLVLGSSAHIKPRRLGCLYPFTVNDVQKVKQKHGIKS